MPDGIQHPHEGSSLGDGTAMWDLRLFVAGDGLEVQRVRQALEHVCEEHVPGRYRIAMVDVLQNPEQADAFNIVATPTLVRQAPPPARRVVGDLSLTPKVMAGLGIPVAHDG